MKRIKKMHRSYQLFSGWRRAQRARKRHLIVGDMTFIRKYIGRWRQVTAKLQIQSQALRFVGHRFFCRWQRRWKSLKSARGYSQKLLMHAIHRWHYRMSLIRLSKQLEMERYSRRPFSTWRMFWQRRRKLNQLLVTFNHFFPSLLPKAHARALTLKRSVFQSWRHQAKRLSKRHKKGQLPVPPRSKNTIMITNAAVKEVHSNKPHSPTTHYRLLKHQAIVLRRKHVLLWAFHAWHRLWDDIQFDQERKLVSSTDL